MGGVPSVPTDPSRPFLVIGAGYSRTGTVSMQLALSTLLDGPVLHGGTQILGREDAYCRKWVQAYAAKHAGDMRTTHALLRELMAGFVACTDMPPIDFLPELLAVYPEARVVLTTRDPDAWLESIRPVAGSSTLWWLPLAMWPFPGWRWFPSLTREFGTATRETLGLKTGDRNPEPSTKLLLNWNNKVKSLVPPERLLIMNVKEGWAPLCKFLDVPIPAEPFPRANDGDAVNKAAEEVIGKLVKGWLAGLTTTGIVVFGAWKLWKRR